jgi:polysaccharide export outer membrane protein
MMYEDQDKDKKSGGFAFQTQSLLAIAVSLLLPLPGWAQLNNLRETEALPTPATEAIRERNLKLKPIKETGAIHPAYILGPGDQIEITVFGFEEFTGAKVILPDGTITLPVIGSVMAAGRTPDTLARELTTILDTWLVEPSVNVSLNILRPVWVNVAGEVQRPGPVQLRSLTVTEARSGGRTQGTDFEGTPTVSSAIMEAGGVTQNGDIRQVVLKRSLPEGNSHKITINLWDAIWSENADQDLIVQDGDSIFVPALPAGADVDRRLVARSKLAPDTVRVRVVGEVKRPGEVEVPPNSALSSAVAIAGGPTEDAELREVVFIRLSEQGDVETQQVNLSNLNDNFQIQEGDVLMVPKKEVASTMDFISRLVSPFNFLLNVVRLTR